MIDSAFIKTLFQIIRAGLELKITKPEEIDFEALRTIGEVQSITPIIWYGLKQMGINDEQMNLFSLQRDKDVFLSSKREYLLGIISECFREEGIPFVPLKGSVICKYYPYDWMRTSCDIDVLVPEDQLDEAVKVLEEKADYTYVKKLYHDVTMLSEGIYLELHFSIKEKMDNIDKELANVWNYVKEGMLTPEFQIFHMIAHMLYHFMHGGIGIRPFLDLWLLRNKMTYNEEEVRRLCDSCGILKFYEECCNLSMVWLEEKQHTEITRELEQICLEGGVFGSEEMLAVENERKRNNVDASTKMKYGAKHIFADMKKLKEFYPTLKKYPFLFPYYQVRRWMSILSGKFSMLKRKKKDRRILDSIDKSKIDDYEHLMKSLEL